jgi:hypothetical protein
VDVREVIELFARHVLDHVEDAEAGIVDQEIEISTVPICNERVSHLVGESGEGLRLADIER